MRKTYIQLGKSTLLPLIVPFLLLILLGTLVYSRLENWTLIESLYVTIITLTTVGYGDLTPQSDAGRIFAIFFTIIAIGLAGYALSSAAAVIFEGQQAKTALKRFEKRMKKISNLTQHIIICGGGIVANRCASEFKRRNIPFVIIETDEEPLRNTLLWLNDSYVEQRQRYYDTLEEFDAGFFERKSLAELADEAGVLYILDDPTDEQQLRLAGVDRAFGIVAAMEDDRDNTTIILSARDMSRRLDNAGLRVVTSSNNFSNIHTLYLAGADRVVAPDFVGGFTVASNMMDHDVAEYWDQMIFNSNHKMRFGDINAHTFPEIVGQTVAEIRQSMSQLVIAIRRDGQFMQVPEPDEVIRPEDVLIVIGPNH